MPIGSVLKRLRKQMKSREATTGVPYSPQFMDDYIQAQLEADYSTGIEERKFRDALQFDREKYNSEKELMQEKLKAEKSAAKMSGISGLVTSGAMVGLSLKGTDVGKDIWGAPKSIYNKLKDTVSSYITGKEFIPPSSYNTTGYVPWETSVSPSYNAGYIPWETSAQETAISGTTDVSSSNAASATATGSSAIWNRLVPGAGLAYSGMEMRDAGHNRTGMAMSGAGIGLMAGGPVGALIGAGIGYVAGFLEDEETVICTELFKQGYFPIEILELDSEYRKRYISDRVYKGYMLWANYVVSGMQKSKIVTSIVAPFGKAWAYHMAHKIKPSIKDNKFGWLIEKIGIPICWLLGGLHG